MFRWIVAAALSFGALQLFAAGDDLASRVIVLANSREPESVKLAEFYAQKRAIPPINIIALPLSAEETITWREFIDQLYRPLQKELVHRGWIDGTVSTLNDRLGRQRYTISGHHISYLVTCRGVPLRIANDPSLLDEDTGRKVGRLLYKDEAAVDSELSLLAQSGYEITGTVPNPFFGQEIVSALDAGTVIKVSRLDGPTFESAHNLVTSALEAERSGLIGRGYVDLAGPHPDGDRWLQDSMQEIEALGFDGDVERTTATFNPAARFDAPVLYFGWYANELNGPFALPGFKFPPGAIAIHIHSYSARTLHSDKIGWSGPLVARGVTATVGNVFEPYLQLTHRPDLLLQALSQGKTFGDAAYYALPVLSWESIAIGDPLYRPFKVSLEQQERHLAQLPADLAPYVLTREANLMLLQGKRGDAWTLLRTALKKRPGLVLALGCAKLAFSVKALPEGIDALKAIDDAVEFQPEDWPLVLQVASLLAAHDARPAALKVYTRLVKMKAPTANDQRALLIEAKGVADAAKDQVLSDEFARQFNALPPPLMAR
ncbi:MAG TPA: TIGR03790 family protein [Lacunisphaera sp.]